MTIRRATEEDFLPIAALDREAWKQNANPDFIPDGEHAWRHWVQDALVFCAESDKRIVGAALAFPTLDHRFCLHKIFVALDQRGKGVGGLLMEAILKEIDQLNRACYLTVSPDNNAAIALYKRLGFTDERFVKGYYRPNEDRLELNRPAKT